MTFAMETEKVQTINALKTRMTESVQIRTSITPTLQETEEESPSLMALFYGDHLPAIQNSPIEQELLVYQTLPDLSKYETTHKKYSQHNPYTWWKNNQYTLPLLTEQARIYLGIPASSVPSERLFSAAGNIITDKRNRLDPTNVHDLLFLKEYQNLCNVFPSLPEEKIL